MRTKHTGFILAVLLIVFFLLFTFRSYFYEGLVGNYNALTEIILLWIPKIITIILIIILAHIVIASVNPLLMKYFKYVGKEKEYFSVRSIVKYSVWFLAIIGILSVFIGNLGVWLTSLGLIGFGVTFALQKPILNFVGWLTITFNRTFMIGDRIKVGEVRGDVVEIQMMYTIMDGLLPNTDELSGKIITLPNEMVLTTSITNFTKTGEYLWDELGIDITYESNWKKAEEILREVSYKVVCKYVKGTHESEIMKNLNETLKILKHEHKKSDTEHDRKHIKEQIHKVQEQKERMQDMEDSTHKKSFKEPIVRIELRDSSIGLNVRYLAHYKNLRIMKSEINTNFLNTIRKEKKINIAYPHMQIVR